ncbi:MAG TPA: hypothetical protein VLH77_04820, partial [Gammaproteobacteria bacterium]|nr:hypothetical protein [Gammaproteobacteria bacterium]
PQNLMKYCLHARPARYGVETPELVDNQDYDPEDKESTEKIVKNNSLYYFRSKYVNHVIPTFIQECSKQALACMLSYYDARFLAVDASGRIYNQKILRMQSQLQPHTFFYLPRPPSSAEAEPLESCLKSPR